MSWDVNAAVTVWRKTHVEGETLTPGDIELDLIGDVNVAVQCWEDADRLLTAAKAVKAAAAVRVGQLLGDGGAVRAGNRIIRFRQVRTERCVDPEGAVEYLTQQVKDGLVDLSDVMNPQYMKRGWMSEAVRDTFYCWETADEPTVVAVAYDRAPKFLQALKDGETI